MPRRPRIPSRVPRRAARASGGGLVAAALLAGAASVAAPSLAWARWRLASVHTVPAGYNQGIAFDPAARVFWFSGASGVANSGLYRTGLGLRQVAGRRAILTPTRERYNHVGDIAFDSARRRVLLALECYRPRAGGNTCGSGAVGVAGPARVVLLYHVNLAAAQIAKAMWIEATPDGRWLLTSSGSHLLAYRASDVNLAVATLQGRGVAGGIPGRDLGAVLATPSVTGGAIGPGARRLYLALNRGRYSQVVSYALGRSQDGAPAVASAPRVEISVTRSLRDHEPEGLAFSPPVGGRYPLGGPLHWLMVPLGHAYGRVLTYRPA